MSVFPNLWLLALATPVLVVALGLAHRHWTTPARAAVARRVLLAAVLVVMAVRPMAGTTTVTTYTSGVDVVIMIDRTTSMAAEDHAGGAPRLDGVTDDVAKLVESVHGSRFAVVVFDNEARMALPFTTDAAAAISLAAATGWREDAYGTGTDISVGLPVAQRLLERSEQERPDSGRYLIYVGDGEQTSQEAPSSFDRLAPLVDGGLVLGYGTDAGGPMKQQPGADTYVTRNGEPAISVIDEANLRRIAEDLGVPYEHRTTDSDLVLPVSGATRVANVDRSPRGFELYWIAAALGVVILAVDLWDGIGRLRWNREDSR